MSSERQLTIDELLESWPVVSSYTREQAIADGVLIDVTTTAREAGYVIPVAITANLFSDIQAIPASKSFQDVAGRLWDVLFMGYMAIRRRPGAGSQILYSLIMHVGRNTNYTVKAVIGPGDNGEPVITLMRTDED